MSSKPSKELWAKGERRKLTSRVKVPYFRSSFLSSRYFVFHSIVRFLLMLMLELMIGSVYINNNELQLAK